MLYVTPGLTPKYVGKVRVPTYKTVDLSYYKHIRKYTHTSDVLSKCTSYMYLVPHLNLSRDEECLVPQG